MSFANIKVCAALYKGGKVHYNMCADSDITNQLICEHVTPNIRSKFSENVSVVLGRALLW